LSKYLTSIYFYDIISISNKITLKGANMLFTKTQPEKIKESLENVINTDEFREVLKIPFDNDIEKYYSEYQLKNEKTDEMTVKIRVKWLRYGESGLYTIKSFTVPEIADIILRINKIKELKKEKRRIY
jgi:hypothetical protein